MRSRSTRCRPAPRRGRGRCARRGTAVGEDQILASIFAKRAKERDALRAVVDAFNEVLPARHGVDALGALKERFAAFLQREESIPCRAALDAVQTFERKNS